jgi:integrase/recombinase XerD
MKDENLLGPWVRRFLLEHLVAERNLSRNTQASYRDTLMLLLPFASKEGGSPIDRMTVEDLTPAIVRKFLYRVEIIRQCSGATRNQRLASIRSLAKFIGMRSPVHLAWCTEIRAVPFKKTAQTVIEYLEKVETNALLNQPNQRTPLGARDHALLLFLYNTGARADEVARLTVGSLQLGRSPSVRLHGKGNKFRHLPLVADNDNVFGLPCGEPRLEWAGIHESGQSADHALRYPPDGNSLRGLGQQGGADIGDQARKSTHDTTYNGRSPAARRRRHQYDPCMARPRLAGYDAHLREVDLEMKAKALASVDLSGLNARPERRSLPSLVAFLKAL